MSTSGLVELLLHRRDDPPEDLDTITESTERDRWGMAGPQPRPDDLDVETRSIEQDQWMVVQGPEDLDTVTKSEERDLWSLSVDPRPDDLDTETAALETDAWMSGGDGGGLLSAVGPKPAPHPDDLDTLTHSDNEADSWSASPG